MRWSRMKQPWGPRQRRSQKRSHCRRGTWLSGAEEGKLPVFLIDDEAEVELPASGRTVVVSAWLPCLLSQGSGRWTRRCLDNMSPTQITWSRRSLPVGLEALEG